MRLSKKIAMLVGVCLSLGLNLGALAVPATPTDLDNCLESDFEHSTACSGIWDPGNDYGTHDIFEATDWMWGDKSVWNDIGSSSSGSGGLTGTWSVGGWGDNAEVIAVLKAGDHAAAFMVDINYLSGTWDISGDHWKVPSLNGLSHIGFWGKGTTIVPEPGSAVLILLGLVGLVVFRKKRQ